MSTYVRRIGHSTYINSTIYDQTFKINLKEDYVATISFVVKLKLISYNNKTMMVKNYAFSVVSIL